jgi:putative phosphonate metabolism protein
MTRRYAIYYAPPPHSPLARFGAAWLGRDAESGETHGPHDLRQITRDQWRTAVSGPAAYGFHATLKPPFALNPESSEADLFAAMTALCRSQAPLALGRLRLTRLGRFLALMPEQTDGIATLAARCVRELDHFRAPPPAHELERRRAKGLSDAQEHLLQRWGYPYVLEEFRFHMTLTGNLSAEETDLFEALLETRYATLPDESVSVGDICVFRQETRQDDFVLAQRFALGGV